MSKFAVLILAAGSSSRMGVPKQLLKWKGTNLLQYCMNSVKDLNADTVLLVLGANSEAIRSKIDTNQVTVLVNEHWKNGLGNTIAFGVNHITTTLSDIENILIMLVDQPLIDSNFLKLLIKTHVRHKKKLTCTLYQEHQFGVPAIFNKNYFEELSQLNDDFGAKRILKKYVDKLSYVDGKNFNLDIDTIADYEALYKTHH